MRFMHLGDLHIGKRVNEISMLDDQSVVLSQIAEVAEKRKVDAVVIAGDVYDKAVPSVEALRAFEGFLIQLSRLDVPVCVIAGNHDSAERLSFGAAFMELNHIHIAREFTAAPQRVRLSDEYGPVDFHLLPFVKPTDVRMAFPDEDIASYDDAVRVAIGHMDVDADARNVLVAHQFVTAAGRQPEVCDSETVSVGGVDNVDASLFDAFDYVALGHLHGKQSVGRAEVRYCGSPLKYSFSEAPQVKAITIVELDESGGVSISELPLTPRHDMREVSGFFEDLKSQAATEGAAAEDYLHVTLSDDHLMEAMARVREFYPNVMRLDFASAMNLGQTALQGPKDLEKSLPELFEDFFKEQLGADMDDTETALVANVAGDTGEARR